MADGRLRVTILLGPADTSSVRLFMWLLRWIIDIAATAPCPVRFHVEALSDPPPAVEDS